MDMVWEGAEALRPFLVEVETLEPFPGNPRRGDVSAVRESLERFGQIRPLLVDGEKVVAGHHVRLAAIELGWSHVAAISNEFATDEEARAYLLADNRTHDLGPGYDPQLLIEHLQHLDEYSTIRGTGYTADDIDALVADQLRIDSMVFPSTPSGVKLDMAEVVLLFSREQHFQFAEWVEVVAAAQGTDGLSETVYEAFRQAAGD